MEDIAESIREATRQTRMKKISISSTDSSALEPISRNHIVIDFIYQKSHMRRIRKRICMLCGILQCAELWCVYRGFNVAWTDLYSNHWAISVCVRSIEIARQEIEKRASTLDAELFQIKHLLILREQIVPFQLDFTIKEYSLDFSKVKTAAFGLLEKSSRFFILSNNALLQFLLEGAPQMKEQLIDSRKHVDAKLRFTCQRLIQHATYLLIYPIIKLLEKEKLLDQSLMQAQIRKMH